MDEIKKISVKDFFIQVKNMAVNPKNALNEMGDTENYSSIAVPQLFLSMALIPLTMLISMLLSANEFVTFRMVFSMWLLFAGATMFYYSFISWGLSKLLWNLKDSMGFDGTQNEFNRLVVLSLSGFFIGNSFIWFISFIGALSDYVGYLAPLAGAAISGYILYSGFNDEFNVSEEKKNIFLGIMVGTPFIAFVLFHIILGTGSTFSFK